MPSLDINYLAVAVSGVAAFMLGGLWYSPLLFANQWTKLGRFTPADIEAMKKSAGRSYAIGLFTQLLTALILAALISLTGAQTPAAGAGIGLLAWVGFVFTAGLMNTAFSGRSLGGFLIDTGYHLAYLAMMGAILGAWR